MSALPFDEQMMQRAIDLAYQGEGRVEPNPMVGAVLVDEMGTVVGEGFHERHGGPHAEVNAITNAGSQASGAALYVTLEPCCHHGKTGPCTEAVIRAGIKKVFVSVSDPAPHASGQGIAQLQKAGLDVETGVLAEHGQQLIRPFTKWMTTKLPYVHAKWAMSLDGKIATRTRHSQWISSSESREIVHRLRARMDAVIVGAGTAHDDDPLLTARPPGPRVATRVVVTANANLAVTSKLVRSIDQGPVLLATSDKVDLAKTQPLVDAGVEVVQLSTVPNQNADDKQQVDLQALLQLLGEREMTNVLIEGGGQLLGSCFDHSLVDYVHLFIAPKVIGGENALSPVAGTGQERVPDVSQIANLQVEQIGTDVYLHGSFSVDGF